VLNPGLPCHAQPFWPAALQWNLCFSSERILFIIYTFLRSNPQIQFRLNPFQTIKESRNKPRAYVLLIKTNRIHITITWNDGNLIEIEKVEDRRWTETNLRLNRWNLWMLTKMWLGLSFRILNGVFSLK
jgi:hypothetical protein